MRHPTLLLLFAACTTNTAPPPTAAPTSTPADGNATAAAFLEEQSARLAALDRDANLAWFEASVSGSDEAWAKSNDTDMARNRFLADGALFARVRELREGGQVSDPLLQRQLTVLYLSTLGKQVAPTLLEQITTLEKKVEQAFNTYRAKVGGKELTQNQINDILKTSTNSKELQAAWEAQKAVGPLVEPALKELVGLRNEMARQLGFRDYYALRIAESEQDETALLALFDELDALTAEPFLRTKAEVDRRLAKRLRLKPEQLMPWHYQNPYFQEPPDVFDTGLDQLYTKQDPLALARVFYSGIGIETEPVIAKSDLYEKKGKTPHAFSADIDRGGDVRVLANIVPGLYWTQTMVHELGHSVYSYNHDRALPWLLRDSSHPLTTEGLAMMMDRQTADPRWAAAMGVMSAAQATKAVPEAQAYSAFASLQFSRWAQVMLRFERGMYADPTQDLSELWWSLVEKYQGLRRPPGRQAPDYASKIHVVIVPVYYHNYLMGDLFAAQLHEAIATLLGKSPDEALYVGEPRVGTFLKEKLFAPGRRYEWNELTKLLTGAELQPAAFARRFTATPPQETP